MTYLFYTVLVLIAVFFITELVDALKGRDWGENP